jgi:DNA-binding MarR family transcriptional regulator
MTVMSNSQTNTDPELEEGVRELTRLFGRVFRNLKQRGGQFEHGGEPSHEALRDAFERGSLGPRHLPVMIVVSLEGGMSVTEIAETIGLSVSMTSLLVGELSRAGLVERTEDERDRRRTIVTLHEDHREMMQAVTRTLVDPMRRTLQRLSPRARTNFLEGWRILDQESAGGGSVLGHADCD